MSFITLYCQFIREWKIFYEIFIQITTLFYHRGTFNQNILHMPYSCMYMYFPFLNQRNTFFAKTKLINQMVHVQLNSFFYEFFSIIQWVEYLSFLSYIKVFFCLLEPILPSFYVHKSYVQRLRTMIVHFSCHVLFVNGEKVNKKKIDYQS